MNRQISQGFIFFELMLVLVIVSILAAVALPAYKDYTLRAVVSEGLNIIQPVREKIEEYYAHHGRFPKDNRALALPPVEQLMTRHLQGIEVMDGLIIIHYRSISLKRKTPGLLTLRPTLNSTLPTAPIIWVCGGEKLTNRTPSGDNLNNLDSRILPAECRS
jgi:type IV pilus assembly protein PilA